MPPKDATEDQKKAFVVKSHTAMLTAADRRGKYDARQGPGGLVGAAKRLEALLSPEMPERGRDDSRAPAATVISGPADQRPAPPPER